jgi:hypothetical protein
MSLPLWYRRLFTSKPPAPAHRRPAPWSGLGAYLLAWAAVLLICAGMVALTVVLTVPRAVILALQAAARQRYPKKSLANSAALDERFISPAPLRAPSSMEGRISPEASR